MTSSEQLRKIFIGGLNSETTEENLKGYFCRWGECVDVVVMRHSDTGRPRGFGFVTYETAESVDAVLNVESHILDGKKIDPKRAVAREQLLSSEPSIAKQEDIGNHDSHRVFVGGLDGATNEEDVRVCFTQFCSHVTGYGGVNKIEIMRNKDNGKCRGFSFVTFESDTDIVNKVCAEKYFKILNKTVEVRRAESKLVMNERREKGQNNDRRRMKDRKSYMNYSHQGQGNMRGHNNFGTAAMTGYMSGEFGRNTGRGFHGFDMNAMAFAGMMSMFVNYMGKMAGNMGLNQMVNNMGVPMGNFSQNQMSGGTGFSGYNYNQSSVSDSSSSNTYGYKENNYSGIVNTCTSNSTSNEYSNENPSTYDQQTMSSGSDMPANTIGTMFGMDPANFQAALYSAYSSYGGSHQLGVYNNQSSSIYGPVKNTSADAPDTGHGYKPY